MTTWNKKQLRSCSKGAQPISHSLWMAYKTSLIPEEEKMTKQSQVPARPLPAEPLPTQQNNMYLDLAQLKWELREEILWGMHAAEAIQAQPTRHILVFNETVMTAPFPNDFKMPNITPYNGKGDLAVYIEVFHSWMNFERVAELARCRAFPLTLSRSAQSGHKKLPSRFIVSFEQQARLFVTHFFRAILLKKVS